MKKSSLIILPLAAALLLGGCGADQSAEVGQDPVTEITITGDDRMRFDPTAFTVRAGTEVSVTLDNIGRMPKETMGHNLAILTPETQPNTFANAAARHPDNAYIPPQYEDRVVATTDVLGPGEQETITFTAPSELGDYPFVCSFPGHTQAGMRGIMTVVP